MKIALGADFYGFELKEAVKQHLLNKGIEVEDLGISDRTATTPYYETATVVAQRVGNQQAERGILVCGTGMGMAIVANKHPGVYAAVCENPNAAEKSRSINNSNILTLGGFITSPEDALAIVDTWLNTEFTQGWEASIQEWLQNSMQDIAQLEKQQFAKE
ncbi:MAG: RpiB/LacA/LacB family sugar-phosphate isomerase [Fischerella sp.]|jgi:ribose 5-phosphate isomerase B|uniref:RpiB/LacA/LacB family sugar-phosphate isomerase n=1 Tax=Fischerella sp. TaxID=1191 RepID=UPI0017BF69A1|nr:RpiB/LacA/LacB family sugar-phosphate isomerase [Fischerella sp.]NWF62186.1 RpiB/LacA/LacB family sugar-phosphate isomerase [Fischerella sp.]